MNNFASVVLEYLKVVLLVATDPEVPFFRAEESPTEVVSCEHVANHAADESFPGLVRRDLDQLGASESLTDEIRSRVIETHTQLREEVPEAAIARYHSE